MRRIAAVLLPAAFGAAGCTLPQPYYYPANAPAGPVGAIGRPYDLLGPSMAPVPPRYEATRPPPLPSVPAPLDLPPYDPAPPASASRTAPSRPDPDTEAPSEAAPAPTPAAATSRPPRAEQAAAQSTPAPAAPAPASSAATPEEGGANRNSSVPLEGFRPLGGVSRRGLR